jgi:hypothetical protein
MFIYSFLQDESSLTEGENLCKEILQCKEELCSIVGSEFGAKSVEENANCAIEDWKLASESQKVRKFDRETENIRDHVLKAFETACCDFVSQLGNLDENVDVEGIYEVFIVHGFHETPSFIR